MEYSMIQSLIVCPTGEHIVIIAERKIHTLYFPVLEGERVVQGWIFRLRMKDWKGAERSPWGSIYKGAVRKTRTSACQGIYDRLIERALDCADAGEQRCSTRTDQLCLIRRE